MYSGIPQRSRAGAGVGILISDRYEESIEEIYYSNERLLEITLNTEVDRLHLIYVSPKKKQLNFMKRYPIYQRMNESL